MAMNTGSTRGTKRRVMAEINVTPMVDVMLVLLIIFMITAPALKEGFQVDLPHASSTQTIRLEDSVRITIAADGKVMRDQSGGAEKSYDHLAELVAELKEYRAERERANSDATVVINGDGKATYERVVQVWDAVRTAGVSQVSFQVEPGAAPK